MARLKYMEVPKASLSSIPIKSGQVIYCIDANECYYDNANTIRINSGYIYPVGSISAVAAPEQNRLYIDRHEYVETDGSIKYQTAEYATLYVYNSKANWQQVLDTSEVNSFLSAYTEVEPAILSENGRNKAPLTLARLVFTESGDNAEDLLKEIKVLRMETEELIVDTNDITTIQTFPPFDSYHQFPNRNFCFVSINGVITPSKMYKWLDNNQLQILGRTLSEGDLVTIMYIFQADLNTSDVRTAGYTDGGYILNGSIPTKKLAGLSHNYESNNRDEVPSSLALNNAFNNLLQMINTVDSRTQMYVADSSSNNYELVVFIAKYEPKDCNTIIVRTKYDLGSDCCVRINDFEPIPIFTGVNTPIKDGQVRAGTIIQLRYNATQNVFYLINPDLYKVVKDTAVFTVDGTVYRGPLLEVPVTLDNFMPGIDCVDVYYENIKLFEGINFTFNGKKIVLDGFYANDNDTFVFERTRVKASNL